jgi:hypothetical protein
MSHPWTHLTKPGQPQEDRAVFVQLRELVPRVLKIAKRTQFLATNDRVLEACQCFAGQDLDAGALGRVLRYHIPNVEQATSTIGT